MIPTVTPPRTHAPAAHAAAPARAGSGAPSLAAFLDALAPDDADAQPIKERQGDAEPGNPDGKALPDQPASSPLAWLATLAQPIVVPPAEPVPVPAPAPAAANTAPAITAPEQATLPVQLPPATPPGPDVPGQPFASATLERLSRDPALTQVHGPIEIELPAAPLHRGSSAMVAPASFLPTPALAATGTTAPAGQIFAAAFHAAEREKGPASGVKDSALPTLQPSADIGTPAVHAAGNADSGQSLDMTDHRWPHAMMDRIEWLRDEANANDTRIRLSPDNLGSIDVAMRREGDTLHVHFRAAEAETRSLLADAQPQLAQIAEQRGLRLGDAQVGSGHGGQPHSRAPQPRVSNIRPAPAAAEADTTTDARVA